MATYVLIHGAWGGSQMFKKTRSTLQAHGHDVYTPSLTGIGERAHLASPLVNLTTHVLDVSNTVLYQDLDAVTLLGFSYGGMVVTGALEHIADRVAHLVYLDAFVPTDGQRRYEMTGQLTGRPGLQFAQDWLVASPPMVEREMRGSPHPVSCFIEPVYLSRPLEEFPFTRTYIRATCGDPSTLHTGPFARAADHAQQSAKWAYFEIATNHMIAVSRPDELSRVLLEIT